MKFDEYGYLVTEYEGFPSNIGDSCAETARFVTLQHILGESNKTNLSGFVTEKGVLRHPTSPWREDDTSDDQTCPLIAATGLVDPELCKKVIDYVVGNGYRTGNGQLIHPLCYAQIKRIQKSPNQWFYDLSILGQALLLKFPIRWNDGLKKVELSKDSSGDYLNFINFLAYAHATETTTLPCILAKLIISDSVAFCKVQDYYRGKVNTDWMVDIYAKAIKVIWG